VSLCLFLDDDEIRHDNLSEDGQDVWHARTAQQAISLLKSHEFDFVSLDHDLGGKTFQASEEENTGYQVAKFISEMEKPPAIARVHSFNPVGAKRMVDKLQGRVPQVYFKPFDTRLR
jgi:hypothetical protein